MSEVKEFDKIFIDGKKICSNPACFEIIPPERQKYCSDECSNLAQKERRRKSLLWKYYREYRVALRGY